MTDQSDEVKEGAAHLGNITDADAMPGVSDTDYLNSFEDMLLTSGAKPTVEGEGVITPEPPKGNEPEVLAGVEPIVPVVEETPSILEPQSAEGTIAVGEGDAGVVAPEGEPAEGDPVEGDPANPDPAKPEPSEGDPPAEPLAVLKINGQDIPVDSLEDLVTLAQKGVLAQQTTVDGKANKRVTAYLANNSVTDEKLTYAVALLNHDKQAIAKLVSEAEFDLSDLGEDADKGYVPSAVDVTDQQVELQEVIDSHRGNTHFSAVTNDIQSTWDAASRETLIASPQLLTALTQHKQSGLYDTINSTVLGQRALGRLGGLSDLEAYDKVGTALAAQKAAPTPNYVRDTGVAAKPKANAARQRAGNSATAATQRAVIDPLSDPNLSEAEFVRLFEKTF